MFKTQMSQPQWKKFRDVHLVHKYNLIHMLPCTEIPALSGFYLKSFFNSSKRYRLQLPEFITEPNSKFCGSCGAVRVPSFNTKMYMVDISDDTGQTFKALQYTCLHCNAQVHFSQRKIGSEKGGQSVKEIGSEKGGQSVKESGRSQCQEKVNKKSSAKERAKKRKKSTLSSMLSQKNEEKKNNTFSLSLESLMQNE